MAHRTPLIKKISDNKSSSVSKYQDLFVGSRSIAELVRYEIITSLFGAVPGALGLYLRTKAYPALFRSWGKNVFIGKGVTIRVPKRIELSSNVIIDDNALLDAKGNPDASFIKCGNEVEISRNTILSCKERGSITVGNFVTIGRNVLLSSLNQIVIDDNCSIGPYSCILSSGHGWENPHKPIMLQDREIKKIILEENVWLGAHVVVLDGVTIGRNSIVAAGSVVTQDIAPYRIAAGTPARVIATRESMDAQSSKEDILCRDSTETATEVHQSASRIVSSPDEANRQRQEKQQLEKSDHNIKRITQVVFGAIDEINQQRPKERRIAQSINTLLFDSSGLGNLDSLGLLNLIVATEQRIEEEFKITLSLADEKAMSQKDSPFRTVRSLVNYIALIVGGENQ